MKSIGYLYKRTHYSTIEELKKEVPDYIDEDVFEIFVEEQDPSKYKDFLNLFIEIGNKYNRNLKLRGDSKSKRQFTARIREGYSLDDFKKAIIAAHEDDFHKETGYKYITPEFITRADKLAKFMNINISINTPDYEMPKISETNSYIKLLYEAICQFYKDNNLSVFSYTAKELIEKIKNSHNKEEAISWAKIEYANQLYYERLIYLLNKA